MVRYAMLCFVVVVVVLYQTRHSEWVDGEWRPKQAAVRGGRYRVQGARCSVAGTALSPGGWVIIIL